MNAKQRYNQLICEIEESAGNRHLNADDIKDSVSASRGMTLTELSACIRYLTGETLVNYIKLRKIMASYKSLIETKERNISRAIDISGLGSHSAFDKKFKSIFGMSPTEAHLKKDKSLIVPPLTWEYISGGMDSLKGEISEASDSPILHNITQTSPTIIIDADIKDSPSSYAERDIDKQSITSEKTTPPNDDLIKSATKFGLPKDQFEKALQAHELEQLYGLPAMFSELAFNLSEELGKSLKETFSFANSLYELGGDFADEDPEEEYGLDPEERLYSFAYDPYYQFAFFECRIPASIAADLEFDRLPLSTEEILKQDPRMLHSYACTSDYIEFWYFKKAYEYYMAHADDSYTEEDLDEYIDAIASNIPIETAFASIIPSGIWDDMDDCIDNCIDEKDSEKFEDFNFLERMAKEEDSWKGTEINVEFDPENPSYFFEDFLDRGKFVYE